MGIVYNINNLHYVRYRQLGGAPFYVRTDCIAAYEDNVIYLNMGTVISVEQSAAEISQILESCNVKEPPAQFTNTQFTKNPTSA